MENPNSPDSGTLLKAKTSTPITQWIIVVLLVCVLVVQGYALFNSIQQQKVQEARLATCHEAAQSLETAMDELVNMYDEDVYNNKDVDTIQKQTFFANQYQILLQVRLSKFISECY